MRKVKIIRRGDCMIILVFTFLISIYSCSSQPETGSTNTNPTLNNSVQDKFIGEWESLESAERAHTIISRNGENYIVKGRESEYPAIYNKEQKLLQFNTPGGTFDISYLADSDMILISGGGKYKRVSQKH
jgi:hypothetical protein